MQIQRGTKFWTTIYLKHMSFELTLKKARLKADLHSSQCTTVQQKYKGSYKWPVDSLTCLNNYTHRILSYYLAYNNINVTEGIYLGEECFGCLRIKLQFLNP